MPQEPLLYTFGPFSLSTSDRLLRRSGEIVALPPKVVDTLLVLVTANGALVTKEHLLEAVWGSIFVDPNSISQNILRLRKTLDPDLGLESIATVPKRGYRFTAEVTILTATNRPSETQLPASASPAPKHALRTLALLATVAVFLLIAALGVFVWHKNLKRQQQATTRPAIAILGFDDLAGPDPAAKNAWIGTALQETLYSELGADPNIRMISNGAVEAMRKDLNLGRTTTLPPETLAEICKDLDCDLLVVGRYIVSDGKLRVDIALQNVATTETIATFNHTDTVERLLPIIAASGQALRSKLGMNVLSEAQETNLLAEEEREPDALRAYAEGMVRLRALDPDAARPFFEQAIKLEPDYPLAHSGLSTAWAMIGDDKKAATEAGRAFDLSGHLSREERLQVEAQYAAANGKWDEAVNAERNLAKAFPDDLRYGLGLIRALDFDQKPNEALAVVAQLRKLPPPSGTDPRISLAEANAYKTLGDDTRALASTQSAIATSRTRNEQLVLAESLTLEANLLNHTGHSDQAIAAQSEAKTLKVNFKAAEILDR